MTSKVENTEVEESTSDPDYQTLQVDKRVEVNDSLHREDARELTVQRINKIIDDQFSFEIELKEKEVLSVNKRVHDTRRHLDRLRACILAGYYGYGGCIQQGNNYTQRKPPKVKKLQSEETCLNEVMKWKQSLPSNLKERSTLDSCKDDQTNPVGTTNGEPCGVPSNHLSTTEPLHSNPEESQIPLKAGDNESRFYVKRRVIVGNTSKYILPEHREKNDRSTHKWMVYVRGPKENGDLQSFISKVWFLLHPSYQPNDLVEVSRPPFQVTRRGWGEFPVRVQLHFAENRNKRVDIIHHLKLDKTYTGLQTLGSETHVDIELDRKNFDCKHLQGEPLIKTPTAPISVPVKQTTVDTNGNKLDLLPEFNHQFNDHSYSALAKTPQSCDEDIKYPTPPTSGRASRSSSPETTGAVMPAILTYDVEVDLRNSIEKFPIVNLNYNPIQSPYCAHTLDEYFSWHIGKRLAAEWQRSLAVKKHACSHLTRAVPSLTTKDIMNYCRFHGYIPTKSALVEGEILCKVCGEEKVDDGDEDESENDLGDSICENCDMDILGSLTCGNEFLEFLEGSELLPKSVVVKDNDEEMCDIDVVSIPEKPSVDQLRLRLLFLPITEEHEWVQDTTAEIDIHLQGTNIDGVRAPVTAAMLYKACGLLVEDIVRKANMFTWKNPSVIPKTACVLPTHIKQAVDVIPHCDFLTNKYLGVVKPAKEEE